MKYQIKTLDTNIEVTEAQFNAELETMSGNTVWVKTDDDVMLIDQQAAKVYGPVDPF